jgi:LPS sulfotransferase NodH
MQSARGLGCPLEYLHRGFRPAFAERWCAYDLQTYVAALHRHRTESNGVLSIKLFWQDIEEAAHERAPDQFPPPGEASLETTTEQDYRNLSELVSDLLPHPQYVYLERQDRVRQAVSAIIASQTGLWRSIPGVGRQKAVAVPEYSYDRIAGMIAFSDYSHARWRRYFAANGVEPYRLTYEELVAEFAGTAGRLCAAFGATSVPSVQRMQRQANEASDAMVLRFLQDHAARRG